MNKLATLTLFTVLCSPAVAGAKTTTWNLDANHSQVGFKVRHMMISDVRGAFSKFNATLELDAKDVSKSKLTVDIDAGSISTQNDKRDAHLKSEDFFHVEKHPKLTFVSKRVKKGKKGHLLVTGDLSIRGVTNSVTLDVEGPSAEAKDPWGMTRRGFTATTTIDRTKWGLNWNKALEAGGVLVSKDVTIIIDASFVKADAKKKS